MGTFNDMLALPTSVRVGLKGVKYTTVRKYNKGNCDATTVMVVGGENAMLLGLPFEPDVRPARLERTLETTNLRLRGCKLLES